MITNKGIGYFTHEDSVHYYEMIAREHTNSKLIVIDLTPGKSLSVDKDYI